MKRITAVILMFALFLTSALAATAYQKSITVDYNINLEINGKTPTLTDVNGKTVQPFTYEGTTYVPIRAVANEMGADVQYYQDTNTAYINSEDDVKNLYLIDVLFRLSDFLNMSSTLANRFDYEAINDTFNGESYSEKMDSLSILDAYLNQQIFNTMEETSGWSDTYPILTTEYKKCQEVLNTLYELANHYKNYVQINTNYSSEAMTATHQTINTLIGEYGSDIRNVIFNIEKQF